MHNLVAAGKIMPPKAKSNLIVKPVMPFPIRVLQQPKLDATLLWLINVIVLQNSTIARVYRCDCDFSRSSKVEGHVTLWKPVRRYLVFQNYSKPYHVHLRVTELQSCLTSIWAFKMKGDITVSNTICNVQVCRVIYTLQYWLVSSQQLHLVSFSHLKRIGSFLKSIHLKRIGSFRLHKTH